MRILWLKKKNSNRTFRRNQSGGGQLLYKEVAKEEGLSVEEGGNNEFSR